MFGGGGELAARVFDAVERWTPSRTHTTEEGYRAELRAYLDETLNDRDGESVPRWKDGSHVVTTKPGLVHGDVDVDDTVGIELTCDFDAASRPKLRGRLVDYADAYDYVVVCTCGLADADGWRSLERAFSEGRTPVDTTQFRFVVKRRPGGERERSVPESTGSGDPTEPWPRE